MRILLVLIAGGAVTWACGPRFYVWLLTGGKSAITSAPHADFKREIRSLLANARSEFKHVESKDTDRSELEAQTQKSGMDQVPHEFQLYEKGATAFHQKDWSTAATAWRELLDLPADRRRNRSTWAAYMLGKVRMEENPDASRHYFQLTRSLAAQGFEDAQGLAAASLGWEAKLELDHGNFKQAIRLYARHHATGETATSLQSLRITAARALNTDEETLRRLARDPETRQVITADLLSRKRRQPSPDPTAVNWLGALEQEGIVDVKRAERLALLAYQVGEMETADRWLARADEDSLLTLWLRAKLRLWEGELEAAAKLYERVIDRHGPLLEEPINYRSGEWIDELRIRYSDYESNPASRTLAAEVGLIRLQRREFTQAMDVLARAGFWIDAAYLAERVLTIDELKRYMDENWSPPTNRTASSDGTPWGPRARPENTGIHLRHLLARRLLRNDRYAEAKPYFPREFADDFERFHQSLQRGRSPALSKSKRKQALVEAARTLRREGMELTGTELAPDHHWAGGSYTWAFRHTNRFRMKAGEFLAPSDQERTRVARHEPPLNKRFHYRYLAADLGWESSLLMDDNSLELARWYCEVGGWLKNRDPKSADRFYKALVNRCRKTAIGEAADTQRWFPKLDKQGNLIPPSK